MGQEDPLEKEMAIHSSILAWEIPWTKVPGGLQSMGLQRDRHDLATKQQYMTKSTKRVSMNLISHGKRRWFVEVGIQKVVV